MRHRHIFCSVFFIAAVMGCGSSQSPELTDPYVFLRDATGGLLAQDDDDGLGLNSILEFTPAVPGIYFVSARDFGDDSIGTKNPPTLPHEVNTSPASN